MTEYPQASTLPSLTGRVAVVTGAGGGLGGGISRRLAAAGAAVLLHYRTSGENAQLVTSEIEHSGGRAATVQANLLDPGACAAVARRAVDTFGHLDILVNNAGTQPVQPLTEMTSDDWRWVIDTNTTATFAATQAAAEVMREHGGSITHIASIEGEHPQWAHAHYCSAKAAVRMHAKTAALELGSWGIRVNSVSPGLIHRRGIDEEWPEGVARWKQAAPLGRLGRPEDVGDACVFLASGMARWITGQDITVDGGVSAHPTW